MVHIPHKTVYSFLMNEEILLRRRVPLPPEVIKEYEGGISGPKLAKKYGTSKGTIVRYLRAHGVKIRSFSESRRTCTCNYRYFQNIDTEEKAYWLGFLYADGNVYNGRMQFGLNEKDEDHVLKFKTALSSSHSVIKDRRLRRIIIHNMDLVNDLISWGCVPRKTFYIRMPDIDLKLQHHFIRGYFDGDGSASLHEKQFSFRINSNTIFCNQIFEKIKLETKILIGSVCREKRRESDCSFIQISTTQVNTVIKLFEWMYRDATIWLDRKRQKFVDKINLH